MLVASVPDTCDCDKGGRDSPFGEAEKESNGSEAGVVLRGRETHTDDAPDDAAKGRCQQLYLTEKKDVTRRDILTQ